MNRLTYIKNKIIICLSILILQLTFVYAQANTFLLKSPSPSMNGMGEMGASFRSSDPFSIYYNPANGLKSFDGVSVSHAKMETPWLRYLLQDIILEYEVWNVGVLPERYPFKIKIGYLKTYLDLGEQFRTDPQGNGLGSVNAYYKADGITITGGFAHKIWKIPFISSIGYTYKSVEEKLSISTFDGTDKSINHTTANSNYNDFGVLLSIPFEFLNLPNSDISITITPTFGYSVSNVGDSVYYIAPQQSHSGPRYLRTGISLENTIKYKSAWNLLDWQIGREAADLLVEKSYPLIKYQSGLGDIDFFDNVIKNKSNDLVTVQRGYELTVLDFYTLRRGKYIDDGGIIDLETSGYGIKSTGVFYLLHFLLDERLFKLIPEFFELQYNYSEWDAGRGHPLHYTDFESWTLSVNNIDKIVTNLLK